MNTPICNFAITKPGVYRMRNGQIARITHVDGIEAYSVSLQATWNSRTGSHDISDFDIVGAV